MDLIGDTPFPKMFDFGETCSNCLSQGDIIKITRGECDFFDHQEEALGYVVASISCDLEHRLLKRISLVPIYPFNITMKKFLDEKTIQIRKKKEKEQSEDRPYDAQAALESVIANMIYDEANYNRKLTFFISPLDVFNDYPTIAFLDDIRSIELERTDILLKNRICSMKVPWREKFGHSIGNLFNRVSTFTPDVNHIKTWWINAYSEDYSDALTKINYWIFSQLQFSCLQFLQPTLPQP